MGIFGATSPFDADIEKATAEKNTDEDWTLILNVCDKISSNPRNCKEGLKAIMRRMAHADPHVVMQAITLLDACISNCGKSFHLEVASREFELEFKRLLSKAQPRVAQKMRQSLKSWAENDFKNDAELNLIPSLYVKLRSDVNFDLGPVNEKSTTKVASTKSSSAVNSQQEEDDIAKAIELSLKEAKNSPSHQTVSAAAPSISSASKVASSYPSLYPSFGASGAVSNSSTAAAASNANSTAASSQTEARKVRALYDFEAAEENELTFFTGEIIHVLDDSDPNWWKGFNQRGEGLFPSNFVSADLSVDLKMLDQHNKAQQNSELEMQLKTEAAAAAAANTRIEIDEAKIDRLLHLLHEANPEDPSQDSDEMLRLEQEVHQMGPLIDAELELVDRKHAQLTQLSTDLVEAITMYHSLMRDDRAPILGPGGGGYMTGNMAPSSLGYQGGLYGPAGYSTAASAAFAPTTQAGMFPPYGISGQGPVADPTNMAAYSSIPMQFHNGHMSHLPPNNGGMHSLPAHLATGQQQQQHQPQQIYSSPQPNMQQQAGQQQPQNFGAAAMMPAHQQQQQQPPPHQGQYTPQHQVNGSSMPPTSNPHQQTQQQSSHSQFMPPSGYMQHQQMPPYALAGMSNGQQQQHQPPQSSYGVASPQSMNNGQDNNTSGGNPSATAAASVDQHHHYSQLQQQMAAMSMGAASINQQPVTQHFLVQNEPKNNIPIYQQQR